jgi:hypothetical protein
MASSPSPSPFGAPDQDELATLPAYPAPLTAAQLPAYLADNPLVKLYLELTPAEEATLAGLAASDAAEDIQVAQALVASVR